MDVEHTEISFAPSTRESKVLHLLFTSSTGEMHATHFSLDFSVVKGGRHLKGKATQRTEENPISTWPRLVQAAFTKPVHRCLKIRQVC